MSPAAQRSEHGFSLMELLVAMLITVIISGAIYGLILSGQTSFRREPEMADRQQNIRIAMDLIQRDVLLAGQGVPWLGQVFTVSDAAGPCATLNGCGLTTGTLGAVAAAARGGGDVEAPDVLETVSAEEQCPYHSVCGAAGLANGPIVGVTPVVVREPPDGDPGACLPSAPNPFPVNGMLLLATNNYNFAILPATGTQADVCPNAGGANRSFAIQVPAQVGLQWGGYAAVQALDPGAGGLWLTQARIARYEIAPDPQDQAPSLWRSTSGAYKGDGTLAGPAQAGVGGWQLVARGIEDLQVEYLDGTGVGWMNQPNPIDPTACNPAQLQAMPSNCPAQAPFVVRQVRVTLSARSMAPNLVGAVLDGNNTPGSEALRGQLQAVIMPRAAKVGLTIP